jgi:hypothetical protein
MKHFLVFLTLTFLSSNLLAAHQICPEGTTELLRCEAKALIPVIPYLAVCQDGDEEILAVDVGSTQQPESHQVEKIETDKGTSWKVLSEEDGKWFSLTYLSSPTAKYNGILNYQVFGTLISAKYNCK